MEKAGLNKLPEPAFSSVNLVYEITVKGLLFFVYSAKLEKSEINADLQGPAISPALIFNQIERGKILKR